MKVIVAGCDYKPRPHMVSWFARAFKRLGCEVVVVGADRDVDQGQNTECDPAFVPPDIRLGNLWGGRPTASQVGGADLVVMVDCGEDWTFVNDGSAPYAYVWREGNPTEYPKVGAAAGGAPVFCCMINKGSMWPAGTRFMPFAVDRRFLDGPPFEDRPVDFCYTGRQRADTYTTWRPTMAALGIVHELTDYVFPYDAYEAILRRAKMTATVDSARYVGSRGLEAMAAGQVVFWDGGECLERMGLVAGRDHLVCGSAVSSDGDMYPVLDLAVVQALARDRTRWDELSQAATAAIRGAHTYEHRALTIATACGVVLPKTIVDVEAAS